MPNGSSAQIPVRDQANFPSKTPGWSWPRFLRNAGIAVALVGLSAWFVVAGVVPNLVPKNFGVVEPGVLYRSGELTPEAMRDAVTDHGVRTIIDFGAHDLDPAGEARERSVAESLGVRRVVLPLWGDATGDPNRYAEALRIITDPASQPVLIHCAAGSERTGCMVALYRDLVQGWDKDRALAEAADFRHDPQKNPDLRPMFERWRDEIERSWRTGEPIRTDGVESSPFPTYDSERTPGSDPRSD